MRKLLMLTAVACTLLLVAAPAGAGEDEDQAISDEAVLTLADLPEGWEEGDADDDENPAEGLVRDCRDIEAATDKADTMPRADSPDFDDGNDPNGVTTVANEVIVYPKAKGAKQFIKPFKADGEECLLGRAEEAPGVIDASIEDLDLEDFGDDGVGFTIFVTIESNGEEFTFANDILAVRVGRAVTTFAAQNVDGPLPEGPDILATVVDRLEEAL